VSLTYPGRTAVPRFPDRTGRSDRTGTASLPNPGRWPHRKAGNADAERRSCRTGPFAGACYLINSFALLLAPTSRDSSFPSSDAMPRRGVVACTVAAAEGREHAGMDTPHRSASVEGSAVATLR
jgi:hypothetical protein